MQKKSKLKKAVNTQRKETKKHTRGKTSSLEPKYRTQNKQQSQNKQQCGHRPQTATTKQTVQNRASFQLLKNSN